LILCVIVVFLTLSGCAAKALSPSTSTITGCWLPGSGMTACGDLISVDGQSPGGSFVIDLSGELRVSSQGLISDKQLLVGFTFDNCEHLSVPMWVEETKLIPDQHYMDDSGMVCTPISPNLDWLYDFVQNPFTAQIMDDNSVRFSSTSTDAFINLAWA